MSLDLRGGDTAVTEHHAAVRSGGSGAPWPAALPGGKNARRAEWMSEGKLDI